MATGPFTQRKPTGGSYQRDPAGAYQRDPTPEGPVESPQYPTVSLLGVPLAVRLKTARSDVFVSADVTDLQFASAIPGGFSHASISLNRPLSLDPPELDVYGTMYVYDGRSGALIWQGRLEDPGRASGSQGEIWHVNAVGPSAHARDISAPVVYVQTSLEPWRPHLSNYRSGQAVKEPSNVTYDAGILRSNIPYNVGAAIGVRVGHQLNMIRECGQHIARYSYTWDVGITDGNWRARGYVGAGVLTTMEEDNGFNTAGGSVAKVITTDLATNADLVAFVMERINTNMGASLTDDYWLTHASVVVRGTTYTTAGAEDTAAASYANNYILASEVVRDLLGRLLPEYDRANATIATTTHQIDQLAYPDGATAAKILDDLEELEPGFFWAAWEGDSAKFEYAAWPTSVGLEASAKDGFDSPGSVSELFNEVDVRWRDILGRIRKTTRTNPVQLLTDAGLTRRAFIDLGDEMGSSINADRAGDQFLLEHAYAPNAGTLTVQTPILSMTLGRMLQPWELVRHAPGKLIRVRDVKPRVDALNATTRDAVTIFKVVGAEYDARNNACRLALDRQPRTLTRLLSPMTPVTSGFRRR